LCPYSVKAFCEKYKVSYDWLLCGDLQGLQRMTQDQHLSRVKSKPESLKEKLARLSESQREAVQKLVDYLSEGKS
jgi:flagellar biosynthesis chaperone FliJ